MGDDAPFAAFQRRRRRRPPTSEPPPFPPPPRHALRSPLEQDGDEGGGGDDRARRGGRVRSARRGDAPAAPSAAPSLRRRAVAFLRLRVVPRVVVPRLLPFLVHALSIGIYLHPLTSAPTPSEPPPPDGGGDVNRWKLIRDPEPILDERHVAASDNRDVNPRRSDDDGTWDAAWTDAWYNDYWGRPLGGESSHKSWRPVAVWSFRFLKGGQVGRRWIGAAGRTTGRIMERVSSAAGRGFARGSGRERGEEEGRPVASELFVHRFVNVLIHAALSKVVGVLALLLFSHPRDGERGGGKRRIEAACTRYVPQLLFALHPAHVEAVANAANRPHILALLFNATIVDPEVPILAVGILAALGLLAAETAIFQYPAIVLTTTAIRYREVARADKELVPDDVDGGDDRTSSESPRHKDDRSAIHRTIVSLLPRYLLLVLTSVAYLLHRHRNDSLSIPPGLLRPAENPFYDKVETGKWSPTDRLLNYSYVLSLHVAKAFGIEAIGPSHEYGYDCVPEITSLRDARLLLPFALLVFVVGSIAWAWCGAEGTALLRRRRGGGRNHRKKECSAHRRRAREKRTLRVLTALTFLSWMATLFPIAGILKVGTFVADRIVVPSTVGTCLFGGRALALWIARVLGGGGAKRGEGASGDGRRRGIVGIVKVAVVSSLIICNFARRTHRRTAEWMDSLTLMESSLRTCPRSIKSNLEASKLYSGLVPHLLDLEKALELIGTAQSIDPDYCDVHQQFAHVYFQQSKYISFEEEMVQSLMCPFTMGQAMTNWNKYWQVVLADERNQAPRKRYEGYMARIREEVQRREEAERSEKGGAGGSRGTAGDRRLKRTDEL
ncbi:hypothetical protein ACHAWF_012481 [Thalassiosira exigua]